MKLTNHHYCHIGRQYRIIFESRCWDDDDATIDNIFMPRIVMVAK